MFHLWPALKHNAKHRRQDYWSEVRFYEITPNDEVILAEMPGTVGRMLKLSNQLRRMQDDRKMHKGRAATAVA
jgi:hypothetical protein